MVQGSGRTGGCGQAGRPASVCPAIVQSLFPCGRAHVILSGTGSADNPTAGTDPQTGMLRAQRSLCLTLTAYCSVAEEIPKDEVVRCNRHAKQAQSETPRCVLGVLPMYSAFPFSGQLALPCEILSGDDFPLRPLLRRVRPG